MKYKRLEKSEAAEIIQRFEKNGAANVDERPLANEELAVREHFKSTFGSKKAITQESDYPLGMSLYTDLLSFEKISLRQAADDGFWRNLTCRVVPDFVILRWGLKEKEGDLRWNYSRFYATPQRNWLKIVWWMHHLGWQGNKTSTQKALKHLGSDAISQVVERTGEGGYRVELYRKIIAKAGAHDNQTDAENSLRRAMKLNTMKIQTLVPEFYEGGLEGYVDSLFANQ